MLASSRPVLLTRCPALRQIKKRFRSPKVGFARIYTEADVALLAKADALHSTLSGPATCILMRRAVKVYGDARYKRLAGLLVGISITCASGRAIAGADNT